MTSTSTAPAPTAARGRRRPLAAIALAAVALIATGCSSSPAESGGASATQATARDHAVEFAECMREHGVREFPDPDPSGELTIDGVLNGSSLDPESAPWKRATEACEELQPAGFTGGGRRSPEQQEASLVFAECMRENGVEDFPDPVNGEPLVDTNKIPSSASEGGMTILDAAMATCRDAAEDAMANR